MVNPGAAGVQLQVKTSQETGFVNSETYNIPCQVPFSSSPMASPSYAGAGSATYNFAIILENAVPGGGTIVVLFANADLSNVTPADCLVSYSLGGMPLAPVTAMVNAAARQVIFTTKPGATVMSTLLYVSIGKVQNASAAGTYSLSVTTSTGDSGTANYSITAASNYYVLTTGDDANDGLSWGAAKKTINAAIAAAPAGSNILVGYGTYIDNMTVNKPGITIAGNYDATGQPATTKATVRPTTTDDIPFTITTNGVTIKNLIVTVGRMGIMLDGASNCQIRDCTISGHWQGVRLSGTASQNRILGCDITSNTHGVINVATGQGNQVHYCNIYGNSDTGLYNYAYLLYGLVDDFDASLNWWGDASGPNGARLDEQGNPTGLLPGNGDMVSSRVSCRPGSPETGPPSVTTPSPMWEYPSRQ